MPVPMYDALMRDPSLPASWRTRIAKAMRLDATEVARYFFMENDQEDWFFDTGDFPMLVPPLSPMWIEAVAPPEIHSEKFGVVSWEPGKERPSMWGAYIETEDSGNKNSACRWRVKVCLFVPTEELPWQNPTIGYEMGIAPDGTLAKIADGVADYQFVFMNELADKAKRASETGDTEASAIFNELANSFMTYFQALMLAVSFLHCKNVSMDEVTPPPPPRTAQDRRINYWPKPPTSFHTLNINPFKQVVRQALAAEGTDTGKVKRGLHIARGHFRTYDETSGGLFGKYHGTFWIPMHVRGGADHVVEKEYTVTPPNPS